jgi:hypothetical protein
VIEAARDAGEEPAGVRHTPQAGAKVVLKKQAAEVSP